MKYIVSFLMFTTAVFSLSTQISGRSPIEQDTELEITNANGDITIDHTEGSEIIIDIIKKTRKDQAELDKVAIDIIPGKKFTIATRHPAENVNVEVDISLKVPEHVTGVSVENANGRTIIKNLDADLQVKNANGDITIAGVNGTAEVVLVNGDIRIEGGVMIDGIELTNGNITAEVREISEDGIQFELANGTIKVYIMEDIDADIAANIVMGDLQVHDLEIESTLTTKTSLAGKLNAGGPLIEVSAAVGDIHIFRLQK